MYYCTIALAPPIPCHSHSSAQLLHSTLLTADKTLYVYYANSAATQVAMGGGTFYYPVEESAILIGVKETAVG